MTIRLSPKSGLIILITALILIAVFFIYKYVEVYQELENLKTDPAKLTSLLNSENQKILDKVGRLMQLPDEKPQQIVTISDLSTIAGQPLLSKAEVGDVFILYTTVKKAILYRPDQDKIIDVIPVSAPAPVATATPSPTLDPDRP